MIETTVRDWLEDAASVPVALETPPGPPERYVVLEKIASGEENGLLRATITAKSVAPSLFEAACLNETVKARMAGLISLPNVFRCHCDSDYNNTDPRMGARRYQAVFTIYYEE
jgi:hypothetical protein